MSIAAPNAAASGKTLFLPPREPRLTAGVVKILFIKSLFMSIKKAGQSAEYSSRSAYKQEMINESMVKRAYCIRTVLMIGISPKMPHYFCNSVILSYPAGAVNRCERIVTICNWNGKNGRTVFLFYDNLLPYRTQRRLRRTCFVTILCKNRTIYPFEYVTRERTVKLYLCRAGPANGYGGRQTEAPGRGIRPGAVPAGLNFQETLALLTNCISTSVL